jgi:hypothetical protein
VFTVEFLWDRLPLYIVAIYPALMVLAYEIVRAFGIFTRRGILAGSVAVCFVHHCFYEVFDHLGPQLNWWLWNTQSDANRPAIAAVPLNSIFLFATLGPGLITAVVLSMAKHRHGTGLHTPVRMIGAIVVAGFAAPIGVTLGGIPGRLAGSGDDPNIVAQAVVLIGLTAMLLGAGAWVLARAYWDRRAEFIAPLPIIMWTSGALFAVVFAVLWASSLPEYLSAVGGVTGRGTAIGNLPYAAASFLAVLLLLAAVRPRGGPGCHDDVTTDRKLAIQTPWTASDCNGLARTDTAGQGRYCDVQRQHPWTPIYRHRRVGSASGAEGRRFESCRGHKCFSSSEAILEAGRSRCTTYARHSFRSSLGP